MKKTIRVLGILVIIMTLFLNATNESNNTVESNFGLYSLINKASAQNEGDGECPGYQNWKSNKPQDCTAKVFSHTEVISNGNGGWIIREIYKLVDGSEEICSGFGWECCPVECAPIES